jgi:Domain of unknown function (DUF4173)
MTPRLARRIALVALVAGVLGDALFDRVGLGINVPIAVAGILVATTIFRPRDRRIDPLDLWLPPVALVAALVVALRTDVVIVFLAVLMAGLATLGWAVAASGEALTRRSVLAVAALGALAATSLGVGSLVVLANAGSDGALRNLGASGRRAVPVARGILIAVPIVAGFGLLLTSADAVFARVVGNVLSVPFDVADLVGRVSVVVIVAWVVGGLLAVAGNATPFRLSAVDEALGEDRSRDFVAVAGSVGGRLRGSTEAFVVLVAVDALFAAFVVLQLAYLFGGQVVVAAAGVTYSDYAREGYFQLVAVVAGAGILLALAELAARRPEGRSRAFVVAALTLLGLTAVILASAAVRLGLYQQIYGWTELRFYVAASIAWLAIGGIAATVLLVRDRMAWLFHGLAFGAVAVTLLVAAIGPQAYVTQQNFARVLDPGLVPAGGHSGFDAEYAATLGDDAVPLLVEALPRLDPASRATLSLALGERRVELAADQASRAWPAWNLSRERARTALESLR